jgi:hypothetical protein
MMHSSVGDAHVPGDTCCFCVCFCPIIIVFAPFIILLLFLPHYYIAIIYIIIVFALYYIIIVFAHYYIIIVFAHYYIIIVFAHYYIIIVFAHYYCFCPIIILQLIILLLCLPIHYYCFCPIIIIVLARKQKAKRPASQPTHFSINNPLLLEWGLLLFPPVVVN